MSDLTEIQIKLPKKRIPSTDNISSITKTIKIENIDDNIIEVNNSQDNNRSQRKLRINDLTGFYRNIINLDIFSLEHKNSRLIPLSFPS